MYLIDLYQKKDFVFSIEIFPPKTEKGVEKLKTTLEKFKSCTPDYFSVTYGAGGTSRANTHEMAAHIYHELDVPAMAHLTCVVHTEKEIDEVLTKLKNSKITNVMTLRGDPTPGSKHFVQPKGGYHYASELIAAVRKHSDLGIGAAGYPEGHVENPDKDDDRKRLHEKITAGAEFIVTQFFLDNTHYFTLSGSTAQGRCIRSISRRNPSPCKLECDKSFFGHVWCQYSRKISPGLDQTRKRSGSLQNN